MKFVEEHLTTHHLLHTPHRWVLAVLLSPIHAGELHYKKRYHLKFQHAKKLFFFDMCLVVSIFLLLGGTLYYHFYDPTVRSLVGLTVSQSTERIETGTTLTYTLSYINHSDVALMSPILSFQFPKGFIFTTSTYGEKFQKETSSLELPPLAPGANGTFTLEGTLFGSPDTNYDTIVKFSYIQQGDETREFVIDRIITSPRDTPLSLEWKLGDAVLEHGTTPFDLLIQNRGQEKLEGIQIPLGDIAGVEFVIPKQNTFIQKGNTFVLNELDAHTSTTLHGNIQTNLEKQKNTLSIEITPTLRANNTDFPQKKITKNIPVLHPYLEVTTLWKKENAKPTERVPLEITLKNNNPYALDNIEIEIPLSSQVDKIHMTQNGMVKNNIFTSNKKYFPKLAHIKSGETVTLELSIPIAFGIPGNDATLSLTPQIQAEIPLVVGGKYIQKINTPLVKISSQLALHASIRYYTEEGDQLGRGPLPPQVGKETRYFATLVLNNSTSNVENVNVSAELAPGFVWGEKTSVSFGKDVTYDAKTRTVRWTASNIPPHTDVGISFAILFTPTQSHIGNTPIAIQNITATARDAFTGLSLVATCPSQDVSLASDSIAQTKGVKVEE